MMEESTGTGLKARLVHLFRAPESGSAGGAPPWNGVTLRSVGRRAARRLVRSLRGGSDRLAALLTPEQPIVLPETEEELRAHPTLCPLPWLHRYVHMDGKLHVCCLTSQGEDPHPVITGADGKELHASDLPTSDQVTNSPYMRVVKRQMMAGEWPAMCSRCKEAEVLGLPSRRQLENHPNSKLFLKLLGETTTDGTSPAELNFVDLRLGNTCNLKCRMCHPISSTRLIPDYPSISGRPLTSEEIAEYTGITWHKDVRIWDSFEPQLSTVRRIHFAGGEPLIMPGMADLLERCISSGNASHITLSYNTNVFRIPPRVLELWEQFEGLVLACSVDGYGKLNEYIRHPSSWEQIDRNLRMLDARAERLHVYALRLHCTVQAYNVLYLDQLYDYVADGFGGERGFASLAPFIVVNPLNEPGFFDVRILPEILRREAERRLEVVRSKYSKLWAERCPEAPQHIDAVIAMLRAPLDDVAPRVAEFKRVTAALDARRSERLAACAPEVAEAFGLA